MLEDGPPRARILARLPARARPGRHDAGEHQEQEDDPDRAQAHRSRPSRCRPSSHSPIDPRPTESLFALLAPTRSPAAGLDLWRSRPAAWRRGAVGEQRSWGDRCVAAFSHPVSDFRIYRIPRIVRCGRQRREEGGDSRGKRRVRGQAAPGMTPGARAERSGARTRARPAVVPGFVPSTSSNRDVNVTNRLRAVAASQLERPRSSAWSENVSRSGQPRDAIQARQSAVGTRRTHSTTAISVANPAWRTMRAMALAGHCWRFQRRSPSANSGASPLGALSITRSFAVGSSRSKSPGSRRPRSRRPEKPPRSRTFSYRMGKRRRRARSSEPCERPTWRPAEPAFLPGGWPRRSPRGPSAPRGSRTTEDRRRCRGRSRSLRHRRGSILSDGGTPFLPRWGRRSPRRRIPAFGAQPPWIQRCRALAHRIT
jgi:hypothetical protein